MKTKKVSISIFQIFIAIIVIAIIIVVIAVIRNITNKSGSIPKEEQFAGSGSVEDPYQILSEEDLQKLYESILKGESYQGKSFKLINKLELSKELNHNIKTTAKPIFEGVFDGNGKTITGLVINIDTSVIEENYGLFGINKGTINNLRVIGQINVNEDLENSKIDVGILAGINEGTISSCKVEGSIKANVNNADTTVKIGGIAGINKGKIENSSNSTNINSNQQKGGIIALNEKNGEIINCANNGEIIENTSSNYYTAGICAENILGKITSCNNNGRIQGKLAGGIAGNTTGNITSCQNTAEVSNLDEKSNNDEISAGIVAMVQSAIIENCKNTGKIYGLTDIAGIAGKNNGNIVQATNEGEILKQEEVIASKVYIGGITGTNLEQGKISTSKNNGAVRSSSDNLVILGGICGLLYNNSIVENCENNGNLYGQAKIVTPNEDLSEKCSNCINNAGGQIDTVENGELQIGLIYGNIKE